MYGVAFNIRNVLIGLVLLFVLLFGINAVYKGPIAEAPRDDRFSTIDDRYSGFPVFTRPPFYKLAVGMSTDDFLHEYGLDVLAEKDPEKYPFDKDFCIDMVQQEIRVASKNGVIVYVSVYDTRIQGNSWHMRYPAGPAMMIGASGENTNSHMGYLMIDSVTASLASGYGSPEYRTANEELLRKREAKNWAVYTIPSGEDGGGYVVYKYKDNGRVTEIGAGVISPEEVASLPQYEQKTDRDLFGFSTWFIPFDR